MKKSNQESFLWNGKLSFYDVCDRVKPDTVILKLENMTRDSLRYLSGTNIAVVLNASGVADDLIKTCLSSMGKMKIDCPLIFGDPICEAAGFKTKFLNLMAGADIFLPLQGMRDRLPYMMDAGYLIDCSSGRFTKKPHHRISTISGVTEDITVPINGLYKIVESYSSMVVHQSKTVLQQSLFDVLYYSPNAHVRSVGHNSENVDKVLEKLIGSSPHERVVSNHLCTHRVSRLVQKMGDADLSATILKLGESKWTA
jgi:hypothetical protein